MKTAVRSAFAVLFLGLSLTGFGSLATAEEYRLGVGEKLRIKVYEWPDLSGEFAVGPTGRVFLSLIGEVEARDRTPAELAGAISQKLQERAGLDEPPSTTVEITEFRPFFVLGDVQNPGEFAFRPGMNVIQAVSIAGGMYRSGTLGRERLERELISSFGSMQLQELRMDERMARRARLDAELNGAEEVEFPQELLARRDDPLIGAFIAHEQMALQLQRQSIRHQQATEGELQELLAAEIASLEAERDAIGEQLESAEQEREDVRSLVARGLAPAPRQLALDRLVASIAAERRSIETSILRARQNVRQSQQRAENYEMDRRLVVVAELKEVENAIEEARRQIANSRHLMVEATGAAPRLAREQQQERAAATYRILRQTDTGVEAITADDFTPVQPGDTVEVLRELDPMAVSAPRLDTSVTGALADRGGEGQIRN